MTSDKIDKMEKERKAAEASQKAEKEEREAKIKRQEKLVKLLVFGGFVFVIIYNLAKSANEMTKKDSSVIKVCKYFWLFEVTPKNFLCSMLLDILIF